MTKVTIRAVVRKTSYILQEEGFQVFVDRLVRAFLVRVRRRFRDSSDNRRRWQVLKNRYDGQRAFLIGNGPSLNRTPLHLLAAESTMCFNHFNLMHERLSWRPTMLTVIDDRVLSDMAPSLDRLLDEVEYGFFPDLHPYNIDFTARIPSRENVYWLHPDLLTFSADLPWCGINKTVANVGLQVLHFLGFSEVYLLGVDMSYGQHSSVQHKSTRDVTATEDDDPNHFDPRYFGAGRSYHHPRMDETLEKFHEARDFFSERGMRIMNAGVGGALEVFPRVQLKDVIPMSARDELTLLIAPTGRTAVGNTLRESFPEAVSIAPGASWPANAAAVLCEAEDGASRVPKVIFDYVPFGPLRDEYLFLRRHPGSAAAQLHRTGDKSVSA